MPKSIAIYSRKSKFTGKGESIENQIDLCKQYIERHFSEDAPLEILIYEDEGFSGKNTSRPQFKTMLQDAKNKRFSALVCYRLDRISRNVGDFANLVEDLIKLGIDFISIRETFDTSNSMGRAMMYIASVFAQLERETIAERIRDNMYELSKTGRWLGGTTPTGYTSESIEKVGVDGKLRKSCRLKVIPEEAQIVTMIYDKYLETGSLTKTDAYLVQNNYVTKNKQHFTRFAIKSILTNPVYMIADEEAYRYITEKRMDSFSEQKDFNGKHGIMAYNRTLQKEGMPHRYRGMDEWIVSVGKHEGLISGYQWVKVQELLQMNSSKTYKKPRSNVALLSGLLYCGGCGSYMRPKLTKRKTSDGDRIYDYICSMKEKSNRKCCDIKNPNGNLLDWMVCEEIKKLPKDNLEFMNQMDKLTGTVLKDKLACVSELERFKKLFEDNEKEISSLINKLSGLQDSVANQYVIKRIEACHLKSQELQHLIKEAEAKAENSGLSESELNSLKHMLLDFAVCFDHSTILQKRKAVGEIVKRVVWDGSNAHLYLTSSS